MFKFRRRPRRRPRDEKTHQMGKTSRFKISSETIRNTRAAGPLTRTISIADDRGAFDSAKNHKRQRRKRQSVTAKREKSQTSKFV